MNRYGHKKKAKTILQEINYYNELIKEYKDKKSDQATTIWYHARKMVRVLEIVQKWHLKQLRS